ncbi:hypothetical protein M3P21_18820 [Ruegeria sp. 2012CJ41-6]|uniref:Uncharacterized protein n=1 Tax=Ruegeria spongiae TaxID=2942209 RepID=A0ABT0Q842_9RHOB|nr:hypothetical protein [Ruegeria spongiae]MCL6285587.1 hypothetical protein [Ruegeria spongiae]
MNKKTHAKGKDPVAFQGDASAFLDTAGQALEWYHKRPQHGRLMGASPNECLRGFIDQGWGKTVLSRPEVLALAFSEEVERVPDRGRVSYTPRRGETLHYYADELLGYDRRITLRVPAFNPEFVFCFDGDELICQAFPERAYGVLDPRGAEEVNRRGKAFRRQIAEKRRHVALLPLTDETARHIAHMPDAPEAPVAAVVDAGMSASRQAQVRAKHVEWLRSRGVPEHVISRTSEGTDAAPEVPDMSSAAAAGAVQTRSTSLNFAPNYSIPITINEATDAEAVRAAVQQEIAEVEERARVDARGLLHDE